LAPKERTSFHQFTITSTAKTIFNFYYITYSSLSSNVNMKFLSVLFSALSLVAFSQAAAVVAERDMATEHVGVCPSGTAQAGKSNKGYHDELVISIPGETSLAD
jgi:hypothetical protein